MPIKDEYTLTARESGYKGIKTLEVRHTSGLNIGGLYVTEEDWRSPKEVMVAKIVLLLDELFAIDGVVDLRTNGGGADGKP